MKEKSFLKDDNEFYKSVGYNETIDRFVNYKLFRNEEEFKTFKEKSKDIDFLKNWILNKFFGVMLVSDYVSKEENHFITEEDLKVDLVEAKYPFFYFVNSAITPPPNGGRVIYDVSHINPTVKRSEDRMEILYLMFRNIMNVHTERGNNVERILSDIMIYEKGIMGKYKDFNTSTILSLDDQLLLIQEFLFLSILFIWDRGSVRSKDHRLSLSYGIVETIESMYVVIEKHIKIGNTKCKFDLEEFMKLQDRSSLRIYIENNKLIPKDVLEFVIDAK